MFAALGDIGIWVLPLVLGWLVVVFTYFVDRDSLRESVTTFVESKDGHVSDKEDEEEESEQESDRARREDEEGEKWWRSVGGDQLDNLIDKWEKEDLKFECDDPKDEDYVPPEDEDANVDDE